MKIDAEYIAGLKSSDRKSYAEFVGVFASRIYNIALNILQNKEEAEEVAQDVFMKIFQSIESFDGSCSLKTWIYRITVNKSLDALRAKKRKASLSVFSNFFNEEGEEKIVAIEVNHPGIQLEQQEEAEILFSAIDKLPERQKTVFVLYQFEDMSYKEIATTLEISASAVDSLMSRAKKQLREYLTTLSYGSIR
ncbi:RNA polymerase sigma factor [Cytophaga aurantiaca]|uniref:RNA polymerase sigma factor n=1 Tax=Cytophaga aurantiaca TaxID=29530 RepID=UPI00036430CF|nr:RNA polymerase sigma factor [Cytophaga aurantiaca]